MVETRWMFALIFRSPFVYDLRGRASFMMVLYSWMSLGWTVILCPCWAKRVEIFIIWTTCSSAATRNAKMAFGEIRKLSYNQIDLHLGTIRLIVKCFLPCWNRAKHPARSHEPAVWMVDMGPGVQSFFVGNDKSREGLSPPFWQEQNLSWEERYK